MDRDLDALWNTIPTADGRDDEFEKLWAHILATQPKPTTPPLGPIEASSSTAADKPPSNGAPRITGMTTGYRVPKVGTLIQRSTTTNARKLQALMETPPPPPRRRVRPIIRPIIRPTIRDSKARQTIAELFGGSLSDLSDDEQTHDAPPSTAQLTNTIQDETSSQITVKAEEQDGQTPSDTKPANPPPVIITVGDIKISVPYFAAHISRRYKARVGNRRFLLRFDRAGKCRSHREM